MATVAKFALFTKQWISTNAIDNCRQKGIKLQLDNTKIGIYFSHISTVYNLFIAYHIFANKEHFTSKMETNYNVLLT